jgi:hypothetical protein
VALRRRIDEVPRCVAAEGSQCVEVLECAAELFAANALDEAISRELGELPVQGSRARDAFQPRESGSAQLGLSGEP